MIKVTGVFVLLLVLLASGLHAHITEGGFRCGHETEMSKYLKHSNKELYKQKFVELSSARVSKKRVTQTVMNQQGVLISQEVASTRAPIRVAFYTDYLLNDYESRTCYAVGQPVRIGDPSSTSNVCPTSRNDPSTYNDCWDTCTAAMVVDSTRVNYMTQNIIEWTKTKFATMFQTDPATIIALQTTVCYEAQVPMNHRVPGLTNTDFIFYVTARPTVSGVLAWAASCASDGYNSKPIAGHVNISPQVLDTNTYGVDFQRGIVIHEMMHALGFSSGRFAFFRNATTNIPYSQSVVLTTTKTVNGESKTINSIRSPRVLETVRKITGCANPAGLQLEEFGGSGTAGSHWDKTQTNNDVMIGSASWYASATNFAISEYTLALFEDSGWYNSNYSEANAMKWGLQTGCTVLTQQCENWNLPQSGYFCSDTSRDYCTFDLRSKGYCPVTEFSANLAGFYQHFPTQPKRGGPDPYLDYCPVVYAYSNARCIDSSVDTALRIVGESYGATSGCFESTAAPSGYPTVASGVRCLTYRCVGNSTLEIGIAGNYITCPASQAKTTITSLPGSYTGSITCPERGFDILCKSSIGMPAGATGSGGSKTFNPAAPGGNTSSSNCILFGLICFPSAAPVTFTISSIFCIILSLLLLV